MKKSIILCLIVLFTLITLSFIGYITIGSMTYSEGDRTGTILKFSRKGRPIVGFKTWEGELAQGGFIQGGNPIIWEFSVNDPQIVEKVRQAERKGGRWTLTYRQQYMQQFWKGKTDYFVTDVHKTEE